jgi:hypothetical protein
VGLRLESVDVTGVPNDLGGQDDTDALDFGQCGAGLGDRSGDGLVDRL